ncbi:MAG TPA: glycosyltransferase family 2 protein [Burkholderiaceae bacterium]|nr:glycosyltransferase family 2 protein [Burkholderiaceae bacterium]
MSRRPVKQLSKLWIEAGVIFGWVFDSLRETLRLDIWVDGARIRGSLSGIPVHPAFLEADPPPHSQCGFSLPIPDGALDGRTHDIVIKVADWAALPEAPQRQLLKWSTGTAHGTVHLEDEGQRLVGQIWAGPSPDSLKPENLRFVDSRQVPVEVPFFAREGQHGSLMGQFSIPQELTDELDEPHLYVGDVPLARTSPVSAVEPVGVIEKADAGGIEGWLMNRLDPLETLTAVIRIDGTRIIKIRPNIRRPGNSAFLGLKDEEVGIHGFLVPVADHLRDGQSHTVELLDPRTGQVVNQRKAIFPRRMIGYEYQPTANIRASRVATQPKPRRPDVSIVVLNRNGAECLDALFESFTRINTFHPIEIIVIDHASTDASSSVINRWADKLPIRLESLPINDSFSASCNRGARISEAPMLLFLNNDIVWIQDVLPKLLDTLKDPNVGIAGLKLLKTEHEERAGLHRQQVAEDASLMLSEPTVQHLAVRFVRVGGRYWPYEAGENHRAQERVFDAQAVPIVTGAVLMCRRKEFLALGGFDERYFYGYEDVELCLRWTSVTQQHIICRNDLVALHRHGYTRLTGREPAAFNQQVDNQKLLQAQMGLWIKRNWWNSLVQADGLLTREFLSIGIAFDTGGIHSGAAFHLHREDNLQLSNGLVIAKQLKSCYPAAQIRFVASTQDWYQVEGFHAMISMSPAYDPRLMQGAREDLRLAAWVLREDDADAWAVNPGLHHFDAQISRTPMPRLGSLPALLSTRSEPLGSLLSPSRLRVGIHVHGAQDAEAPEADSLLESTATALFEAARLGGALSWIEHENQAYQRPRMADLGIHLLQGCATLPEMALMGDCHHVLYALDNDTLGALGANVALFDEIWSLSPIDPRILRTKRTTRRVELSSSSLKKALMASLRQIEQRIGRTFHSS